MSVKQDIKNISKNDSSLIVEWNDGEISQFNFMWLRDNCPSGKDPDTRERNFNFLEVSEDIYPSAFTINKNGQLEIQWSEGNHTSYFDLTWLRKHCYTSLNKKKYVSPYVLWDGSLGKNISSVSMEYNEVMQNEEGLARWIDLLHTHGVCIIKNAPIEKQSGFKILNKISHTRETFFKTPFEVINIPEKPNNTAYTADGLRNHVDLPYFESPPGYQFLHCLINDAKGGMSAAVDGFKVADYLKVNEPDIFNLLKRVMVKFQNDDYTQDSTMVYHAPMISLTKDGDYNDIRFSVATMGALDCQPEDMDRFYRAYRKFAELIHSDQFNIHFRLEPGDIFGFNNRRVLHGRTEFDPNSGRRHLQGYYIDRAEIIGRLNFFKKQEL